MISVETLQNLKYQKDEQFISQVKDLITREEATSLREEFLYVLYYDTSTGDFVRLDEVVKTDVTAYSEKHFISRYNRICISHNGQGSWFIFFDGKKIMMVWEFIDFEWSSNFYQKIS